MKRLVCFMVLALVLCVGVFADGSFFRLMVTGTAEEVQSAIRRGADVNARDENGFTPLIGAAMHNPNPEVIELLLDAGADVNARDERGYTPLIVAAMHNPNPEMIAVLLDAGADGRAKDREGQTAFDHAKENEALVGTDVYWRLHDAQY